MPRVSSAPFHTSLPPYLPPRMLQIASEPIPTQTAPVATAVQLSSRGERNGRRNGRRKAAAPCPKCDGICKKWRGAFHTFRALHTFHALYTFHALHTLHTLRHLKEVARCSSHSISPQSRHLWAIAQPTRGFWVTAQPPHTRYAQPRTHALRTAPTNQAKYSARDRITLACAARRKP